MSASADSFIRGSFMALIANTALLGGILYCVWMQPQATEQTAHEYAVDSCSDLSLDYTLKLRGEAGWEVASARRAVGADGAGRYEFIFCRPVVDKKDAGILQAESTLAKIKFETTLARMKVERELNALNGK